MHCVDILPVLLLYFDQNYCDFNDFAFESMYYNNDPKEDPNVISATKN